jgi:serine/threonine-protein kinase
MTMANPSMPEQTFGTYFLGRYRVVDEIGIGGMASVHLARMDGPGGFQKWVAIKRIHAHLVEDESFIQMFLDEARVAARISHPNVAQVYELGKHDDTYWIAMEYLHGEPLRELMRRMEEVGQPTPPEIACRVIADAAEGLHAAHELLGKNGEQLNLVHRDVTPHNLFVCYDGNTKVVDFGIAKFSSRMANTRAGTLKGKLAYMSPEQVAGEVIDRRTDIFALGVVLWEMTTNQRLFRMESDLDTLAKVQECNVPRPSTIVRGYPLDLEKIVMKALAKNKNERYKTAREFSRALQSLLMKRGLFIASEEVASYMASMMGERIQKREAHLRWAAEVTQTISLDQLAGPPTLSTGSFQSASEAAPAAPRPAAGMPAPRPAAGAPPRPAAGMPPTPAPPGPPRPAGRSGPDQPAPPSAGAAPAPPTVPRPAAPAPQTATKAPATADDDVLEDEAPTIARHAESAEGDDEDETIARVVSSAGVDDLEFDEADRTIVTGAPEEPPSHRVAPTPAAGRPLAPPPGFGAPEPFAPTPAAPFPPPPAPAGYDPGLTTSPAPFAPVPLAPTSGAALAVDPSGPRPPPQPTIHIPPDQRTMTIQPARRMPLWVVSVASGVAALLLLSLGFFGFTYLRSRSVPPPVVGAGDGPFATARAAFGSAVATRPSSDVGTPTPTVTAPPTTTAEPPATVAQVDTAPTVAAPPPATTATPAPAATPAPVATTKPAPTPIATPTPVATTKPAPTPIATPTPVATTKPTLPTPIGTAVKPPPAPKGPTGLLTVTCYPSCDQVYDNGTPIGYPVIKKSVAVGSHKLKLVSGSQSKVISTIVVADRETNERVSMSP